MTDPYRERSAALSIDPRGVIATLGRLAPHGIGYDVTITSRPQYTVRLDRLIIQGDASIWLIRDITIGNQSQLAQGDLPGDLFASTSVDAHFATNPVLPGVDVAVTISNIGTKPQVFRAIFIAERIGGDDATFTVGNDSPSVSRRCVLPINSNVEVMPSDASVVIELDEVLYRLTQQSKGVVWTPIVEADLTAEDLRQIDVEYDRSELVADGRDVRTRVVVLHALERAYAASLTKRPPNEPFRPAADLNDRVIYPFGLILIDEYIGKPILAIGDFNRDGHPAVEWHPEGYEPSWLAAAEETP